MNGDWVPGPELPFPNLDECKDEMEFVEKKIAWKGQQGF